MAKTPPTARAVALGIVETVLDRHRPLDEVLAGYAALGRLAPRDRAFARLQVATTLRRLGEIDALIDARLAHPLPRRARGIRHVLRLGVCQLVFLGTPAHAAVNGAVALAARRPRQRGLVNAVLRRIAADRPAPAEDAPRRDTPPWLWRRWEEAYGPETARAIAAAHLEIPPLDLTVKSDPEGWAERLGAAILPTGSLRLRAPGAIADLPGFDQGAWWVQDAAAALPARLLGAVAGRRVIDLCAAPGGKTAQLAAAGARVVAVDRDPERIVRLAANLDRLGLAAGTLIADARTWRPKDPADFILLDAPCTATGTIRRHPDIPHLRTAADIAHFAALQDALLAAAADMLAAGGTLVYCVCSLEPEEGPERVAALLARRPELRRSAIVAAEIGGLAEAMTADGALRALPCHLADRGGIDGFYAARLRRPAQAVS